MNRPRVLLADDHRIVAEGLKELLSSEFDLVGIVGDGRSLVDEAKKLEPDVIVADISMPELNGIDALTQMKQENPEVKVVFLTVHRDVAYARRALEAGALGFVLKQSASDELLMAIRSALSSHTYITPALAGQVLESFRSDPAASRDPVTSLTPRQREILQLLAEGKSAKQISALLGISTRTVEFHKYQMMESVGIRTSAGLIHFAIKHGLVEI